MSRIVPNLAPRQKAPRAKERNRLQWLAGLGCWKCGKPAQACHIRTANAKYGVHPGGQNKPSDIFTLPMCPPLHAHQHSMNEREFWAEQGVEDPHAFALAVHSAYPNEGKAREIIREWSR